MLNKYVLQFSLLIEYEKPRRRRPKASWERTDVGNDDPGQDSDAEFDEYAYLRGKVAIRASAERELDPNAIDSMYQHWNINNNYNDHHYMTPNYVMFANHCVIRFVI